jgi:hypothetical protein
MLPPTARHRAAEGQAIPRSPLSRLDGTVSAVHVTPPSTVRTMFAVGKPPPPTATQVEGEGHVTALRSSTPAGILAVDTQFAPPFEVASATPPCEGVAPTM